MTAKTPRRLIQQAYYVPEHKKFYKSGHVHDFVKIDFGDKWVALDGGAEYERCVGDLELFDGDRLISFCLYDDMPFAEIAGGFLWGTNGPKGDQPFKWVLLSECSLGHLEAIKATQPHIRGKIVEKAVDYWIDKKSAKV